MQRANSGKLCAPAGSSWSKVDVDAEDWSNSSDSVIAPPAARKLRDDFLKSLPALKRRYKLDEKTCLPPMWTADFIPGDSEGSWILGEIN